MFVNPQASLISRIDHYIDYTPVASTFINLAHLFQKCIVPFLSEQTIHKIHKSHYFQLVKDKSLLRCVTVLIPFLGNVVVALYDFHRNSQKIKVGDRLEIKSLLEITELPLTNKIMRKADSAIFEQVEAILKNDSLKDRTEEALKLCVEAADLGEPSFIYKLGLYFAKNKNYEKAYNCYLKGVLSNHKESFFALALCFDEGLGVKKDEKSALEWYKKGAVLEDISCLGIMAEKYLKGKGVEKDTTKAILYYNKVFESGHLWAMYELGLNFLYGRDLIKNEKEAFNCFEAGANKGDHDCMYELSRLYIVGLGVKEDQDLGMKYLFQAAEEGHLESQWKLGIKLYKKDPDKSFYWFEKSALKGHAESMHQLGWLYAFGNKNDLLKGIEWLERAANKGNRISVWELGIAYAKLNKGKGTEETIAKEFEWLTKGAQLKNKTCQYNLSCMYDAGRGVAADKAKAMELLKESADQGFNAAMFLLGVKLIESTPPQIQLGYDYITKAAKNGHPVACFKLGKILCEGSLGQKQDFILGKKYYEQAVHLKYPYAFVNLGRLLLEGVENLIPKNPKEAFKLFKSAAELNVPDAMYELSLLYESGNGTDKNETSAFDWLLKAVNCNVPLALFKMGQLYERGIIFNLKDDDKPQLTPESEACLPNIEKAIVFYERAINKGYVKAYYDLAVLHLTENGIPLDLNKVIEYLKKAEEVEPVASYLLGNIYSSESELTLNKDNKSFKVKLEVSPQYDLAIAYYEKAAKANIVFAMEMLGYIYFNGPDEIEDVLKGREWYQKAINLGSTCAMEAISVIERDPLLEAY